MDAACLSALPQDQLAAPGFEVGRSGLVALPASRRPPLPRLVVPTTLGTGAEVSATACCDGGSGKLLVLGDALRPELAAIDPAATRELPVGMAREAVVEVLARLLVPYAANPAGEAGVGRVADAHVLADLGTLGSLAASASASGFDDDTRLTLATVSAHSHAGWGTLGRPLFASPLWFVATELSAALQTTKATATALLLPAWATAVLVGDRRWGDAARLRTAWSALDAEAGPDLAVGLERFCRSFTDALGEVRRSIGVTGLRALAESVGVRCVRRWGAGLPMLGSLDVLAVEDLVRRAVRPPQELLTAGAGVVPRG